MKSLLVQAAILILHLQPTHAIFPFFVPFYGTSANNFTSAARGWNSFGLQAASNSLKHDAGWDFNDWHFRQHCSQIVTQPGYDYVCSIDSGWSVGCNGDANGIPLPDTNVIPDIVDLANYLQGKGLKLGIYVLPGAFTGDATKLVEGTSITIGSLFDPAQTEYNCRRAFDYSKDGVQQWHDSVVRKFASWGVDFIKLDYMTPGSPDHGNYALPPDSTGTAIAYHKAIAKSGRKIRLGVSWKLNRSEPYWSIWKSTSETLRTDQDINNSNQNTFVSWSTVLRAIDFYRQFINEQTTSARSGIPIMIRPDLDNTFVGNAASISGLSNVQRYTMAIHWIGAGANLITASDMTRLDTLGKELLYNTEALSLAAFTSQYPMQPRNPDGWGTVGAKEARQVQAWISGPDPSGTAVVVLSNYGPDPCLNGGCTPTYGLDWGGDHLASINLTDLGLVAGTYSIRRVWGGGGRGGEDHSGPWNVNQNVESWLGPGESVMYKLQKQ